jgi:hypothetical protein
MHVLFHRSGTNRRVELIANLRMEPDGLEFPHFCDVKLRCSSGDDSDYVREVRGDISTGTPNTVGLSRSFTDHTGRCRNGSLNYLTTSSSHVHPNLFFANTIIPCHVARMSDTLV